MKHPPQLTWAVSLKFQDLQDLADLVAERAAACEDEDENARWTRLLTHLRGIIGRLRKYEGLRG